MKSFRKNIRLKDYDYTNNGAYFITICTQGRLPILVGDHKEIINQVLQRLQNRFTELTVDFSCLMPNHIHLILILNNSQISLPRIIQAFKSVTTLEIKKSGYGGNRFWQPNYYEHIIRNEKSLDQIRQYVINNPLHEKLDWNELDGL